MWNIDEEDLFSRNDHHFKELVKELYPTPSNEKMKEVISIHRYLLVSKAYYFHCRCVAYVATLILIELVKDLYPTPSTKVVISIHVYLLVSNTHYFHSKLALY